MFHIVLFSFILIDTFGYLTQRIVPFLNKEESLEEIQKAKDKNRDPQEYLKSKAVFIALYAISFLILNVIFICKMAFTPYWFCAVLLIFIEIKPFSAARTKKEGGIKDWAKRFLTIFVRSISLYYFFIYYLL